MIGRVKKWLGIEGVKLELALPEVVYEEEGAIRGICRFRSMNTQTVTQIRLVLIERFVRGRGKEKMTDEYELGQTNISREIEIPANGVVEVEFELPFALAFSEIDEFGRRNALFGGLAKVARYLRNAHSEYRLEAEARVKGVALNPFDRKLVTIKRQG